MLFHQAARECLAEDGLAEAGAWPLGWLGQNVSGFSAATYHPALDNSAVTGFLPNSRGRGPALQPAQPNATSESTMRT